jgi:hypothetical protein
VGRGGGKEGGNGVVFFVCFSLRTSYGGLRGVYGARFFFNFFY